MKCILGLSELETLFFSDPTHHHTWQKRKILDPSSKSLAQRQEVVHVVSSLIFASLSMFAHSPQVLWLFCSWSISWNKSQQDSASCVFSVLFLLSDVFFCRICQMNRAVQDAYELPAHGCLVDLSPPQLTKSFLSCTWINSKHSKYTCPQIALWFFQKSPVLYAEDQV